ncbi:hypothetical protein HK096_000634 [Nowakowskiella sp. JEL0078]|nr:hypothetical protein HK096_000634 [Nowakowskiella sp. JEL0078]
MSSWERHGSKQRGERTPFVEISEKKLAEWKKIQYDLRKKQISDDDFNFTFPSLSESLSSGYPFIKYVAGVDISCKGNRAVVGLAIMKVKSRGCEIIGTFKHDVVLSEPYKAGFLAFREAPAVVETLEAFRKKHPDYYPQVLLI